MPTLLRPQGGQPKSSQSLQDSFSISGNRVLNMQKLSDSLAAFNIQHAAASRDCIPHPVWPAASELKWGLAVEVKICCIKCKFESATHFKMFDVMGKGGKGRKGAKVNTQLVIGTFKTCVGYDTLKLIFSTIDCTFMTRSVYFDITNSLASTITEVAKDSIDSNIEKIKKIAEHNTALQSGDGFYTIPVQTDTCFNNRGINGPTGTQAVTPCMENITNEKLLISMLPYSQLCSKNFKDCNHESCGLNYSRNNTINSVERKSGEETYRNLHEKGILVKRLCHDGFSSSSHLAGMRDACESLHTPVPESSPCASHMKRNNVKQIHRLNLSEQCLSECPRDQIKKKLSTIGHGFARRIALEIKLAAEQHKTDTDAFIEQCRKARRSILPCAKNDHTFCKTNSLVCDGVNKTLVKSFPGRRAINPTPEDEEKILTQLIDYRMADEKLKRQQHCETTNRVESSHRSTQSLVPKTLTFRKHFNTRVLSSAHTECVGIEKAVIELSEKRGVSLEKGGKARRALEAIQHRKIYHKLLRRSLFHRKLKRKLHVRNTWQRDHKRLSLVDGPMLKVSNMHTYSRKS